MVKLTKRLISGVKMIYCLNQQKLKKLLKFDGARFFRKITIKSYLDKRGQNGPKRGFIFVFYKKIIIWFA